MAAGRFNTVIENGWFVVYAQRPTDLIGKRLKLSVYTAGKRRILFAADMTMVYRPNETRKITTIWLS